MSPRRILRSGGAVLLLLWMIASPTSAQQRGYIVLHAIPYGPADVYVNDEPHGKLSAERTLEMSVGTYRIRIEKDGYSVHEDTVVVIANDVAQVRSAAQRYRAEVMGDKGPSGIAGPGAGTLRVLHLNPVAAEIRFDGAPLGMTPSTLVIPGGAHKLEVGAAALCVRVPGGSEARILVRSGIVEETSGFEQCTPPVEPVLLNREEVIT